MANLANQQRINNKSRRRTRPASAGVLVINMALLTMELGFLTLWEIPEEYHSLLDHELIFIRWDDASYNLLKKEL